MFGREQAAAIRAGFFVVIVSVGMAVIIFVLGTERGLFKQRYEIKTTFSNVRGLREGAPVRLAGMDVGEVDAILFPKGLAEKNMEVVMRMSKGVQDRIREDSEATIKWLSYVTGDSYIEITIGSSDKPAVKEGGYVMGIQPIDYTAAFEGSINTLNAVAGRFKNLEGGGFFDALNDAARSIRAFGEEIKGGEGLMHAMIFDPEGGKILSSVSESVQEFKNASKKFAKLPDRIDELLAQISTNKGLLYSLLYDAEKSKMLDDLSATLANLKDITDKTAAGEGTLGAIINDPTLYDDLKMLLGGAERSYVLRTLIRHSLESTKKEQLAPTK
ncbi:MAG TPA: MlaD family protein [Candidatus Brocadiia bacterium]|nr:MlaD family protein [Candidatus Brocadiales bacterium]